MKSTSNKQFLSFFYIALFTILLGSCVNKNRSNEVHQSDQIKQNTVSVEATIDSIPQLKFTSGIRSILEDSKGNIWFGSNQEGLAMFDGKKFNYYTESSNLTDSQLKLLDESGGLSNNQVRSIYEDKRGVIWFEGGRGVSSYNQLKISRHTERKYDSPCKWTLNDDDLWFKGNEINGYNSQEGHPGVYQYDGQTFSFRRFPVKPQAGQENYYSITTPFIRSAEGTVWFGTYGAAIRHNGSDFKIIDNEYTGLTEETGFLHIRSLMEDSQGNLWIGNNGIGVLKYDGETVINFTKQLKATKEITLGNSLEKVFSIGEDTLGNIWFGTSGSGVWRYDGTALINYTEKDGIKSNHIWTIYTSKSGEIWFGGESPSAVYKFNGKSFERKF